ncbi:MAG TPA: hypothetical protein VNI02_05735 [Blastocatellia bacterium]|nr:hypothetical protein [Blastocatellia bacterium]
MPIHTRRAVADVLPVWLTLAVLTTLPYLLAALRAPDGHVFTGVLTAYDDTFTYLAWMRQGADGRLLMCDLYTSEPQPCEFFLPLWAVLGFVARVTGGPVALIFHAARLCSTLLLLVVARSVARRVSKSRARLRYSLWMYAFSGGLGWLVYALNNGNDLLGANVISGAADLNLPEAIAFRSAYAQVHFTIGAAMVCGAINLLFTALEEKRPFRASIAGAVVSLLAVVHPYLIIVVGAVAVAAFALWPRLRARDEGVARPHLFPARAAFWFFISALPGVVYLFYLKRSNEVLREWLRITDTLSPPPIEYALGFGIVAALALAGFGVLSKTRSPYGRLLLVWIVVQSALLYAPVSFQRRLIEGLQLPLCVAASAAAFSLRRRFIGGGRFKRFKTPVLISVIVLASLTNAGFIAGQIISPPKAIGPGDPRRYVPADLIEALDWLGVKADRDAVLFSSYMTGNIAPSMTGLRVYVGHYGQTLSSGEKSEEVTAFYTNGMTDEAARRLLAGPRVSYVIYGPFERAISDGFVPPAWLALARRVGSVEIFRVIEDGKAAKE